MSHDRGCFVCFEDCRSNCGDPRCPYPPKEQKASKMSKKEDKSKRRSLGFATMSDGTDVHISEPTFGEIVNDYGGEMQINMMSKATGLSPEDIKDLPMSDGLSIMVKTLPLMEKVTAAMTEMNKETMQ